jgi:hypothetical protein
MPTMTKLRVHAFGMSVEHLSTPNATRVIVKRAR